MAGNLSDEGSKDDHLVVVVVRGGYVLTLISILYIFLHDFSLTTFTFFLFEEQLVLASFLGFCSDYQSLFFLVLQINCFLCNFTSLMCST